MNKYPPYEITEIMLEYVSRIMEKIGQISVYQDLKKQPKLRRQNRINSIHSSLAIENNKLSTNDVRDVIQGKIVIGDKKDIQEVKNAYKAYEEILKINPYSIDEFKRIHEIMTFLVIEDNGKFRNHGEAVYDDDKIIFVAPPEDMVLMLMNDLFKWMDENNKRVHPLILSSVFHYECLFIHPFSDGNGRMARIWQTAILTKWKDIFEYLPIESLIMKYQQEYYDAISECNCNGNSNVFIEFMLKIIDETLEETIISSKNKIGDIVDNLGLGKTEKLVYQYIENNQKVSTEQIATYIEKTNRTVRRITSKLIDMGLIEWIGKNSTDPNGQYKLK